MQSLNAQLVEHDIHLNYDFWTAGACVNDCHRSILNHALDEILGAILPEDVINGAPSGFAATGHIGELSLLTLKVSLYPAVAHLNLNDEYLPYKHLIGQVLLDVSAMFYSVLRLHRLQKNKGIRTVVNKLDSIDTQFRFFKMELIAGEPNYIVEHVSTLTQIWGRSRMHHSIARVWLHVQV